ncbi:helix-turn-helix transcriptional regulator [Actinomadura chibensis]|uniref:Transcriptional regulator n=1 Tax=Actinomadura chibensis TaxID=392828 RepID=A0A5D0NP32_9ACTN|nr:helix-turn-helix domain-containing protein [Actinomadura chibensis]TYB46276.1 transcriptional regulator [Actinomadura chibensis]
MSGESFGEALRELMAERGIGVRALARQVPCDPGHISRLCQGHKGASEGTAKRLDEIFGSDDRFLALFKATTGVVNTRVVDGRDTEDVERRTLLSLMATAATASSLSRDAELLRAAFETAVAADVGDRDADTWERVAYDYAGEVGWAPAAELQPELAADFAELTALLPTAPGTVRTRLVYVAAQIAALMAINLTNLGAGRSARRWWRTAARAADQTGDHAAAALVRGRAAVFSLYAQTPRLSVVKAAEETIGVGQGAPCVGVVSGYAAKAQALAELGQHDKASDALDDLRRIFEKLPDTVRNQRGSQWGWPYGRLLYVTSLVHTCAGNIEPAMAVQDEALALYPTRNWQGRGQIEMHRAGVLIRAGDTDEGARHVTRFLESLPAERRSDGLLQGSALTALKLATPAQATQPSIKQALELLAAGDR